MTPRSARFKVLAPTLTRISRGPGLGIATSWTARPLEVTTAAFMTAILRMGTRVQGEREPRLLMRDCSGDGPRDCLAGSLGLVRRAFDATGAAFVAASGRRFH